MSTQFAELSVKGNFMLVKGFLVGFLTARNSDVQYFFPHRAGTIRRDTVTGSIKQLMELESDVHVCIEMSEVDDFRNAIEKAHPRIGIEVTSMRGIQGAGFECECELFNEEDSKSCKAIMAHARETARVQVVKEEENIDPRVLQDKLHKTHPYEYRNKSKIHGDFGAVMNIFLELRRARFADFVKLSEVTLDF